MATVSELTQPQEAAGVSARTNRALILMAGAAGGELLYFASVIALAKQSAAGIGAAVGAIGILGVTACAIVGLAIAGIAVYVLPDGYAEPIAKGAAIIGGAAAGAVIGAPLGPIGIVGGAMIGGLVGWALS